MRNIDQLADLPYSEMSEEEIALMVEWRASIKARDDIYRQQLADNRAYNELALLTLKATAARSENQLNDLVEQALERLRAVDNGQA